MPSLQEQCDEAMLAFTRGDHDTAIARLRAVLAQDAGYFDAQLALGMAYYRKGDFAAAIAEGHKAEQLRPHEQLVHTNLSLFYMKSGDKKTAEHHGLQARIASWRGHLAPPEAGPAADPELQMTKNAPRKFPDMPWKKNPVPGKRPAAGSASPASDREAAPPKNHG
jgi:tetratricopeptide (TPR) repeat protein